MNEIIEKSGFAKHFLDKFNIIDNAFISLICIIIFDATLLFSNGVPLNYLEIDIAFVILFTIIITIFHIIFSYCIKYFISNLDKKVSQTIFAIFVFFSSEEDRNLSLQNIYTTKIRKIIINLLKFSLLVLFFTKIYVEVYYNYTNNYSENYLPISILDSLLLFSSFIAHLSLSCNQICKYEELKKDYLRQLNDENKVCLMDRNFYIFIICFCLLLTTLQLVLPSLLPTQLNYDDKSCRIIKIYGRNVLCKSEGKIFKINNEENITNIEKYIDKPKSPEKP